MSDEKRAGLLIIDGVGNILEFPDIDNEDFSLIIQRALDVKWKYPDHKMIRFTGKGKVLAEVHEFLNMRIISLNKKGSKCDGRKV